MKASVVVAKDTKKGFSPTKSDNSIHRVQHEPERQLGSLRSVIDNIRHYGGSPSVDSIATELSSMHTAQRAPVLLALQRTHGNRYVQRVVTGIQAKLKVGQLGDIYEQEADRVADAVMRMPELKVPQQPEEEEKKKKEEELIQTKSIAEQITPLVQRQLEAEGEKKKGEEEIHQTKEVPGRTPEVTNDLESRIQSLKGGGQPLPESVRAFFEPRFGYDFGQVRVHTDTQAVESARVLKARAYTVERDVVFGEGQYQLGTSAGKKLLAHELTHVVQQGAVHSKKAACKSIWGSQTEINLWGEKATQEKKLFASEEISGYSNSLSFGKYAIQFQEEAPAKGAPAKAWKACVMPGKRAKLNGALLTKLDNICGRMKAQSYDTKIYWGYRTLAQQVEIATRGRTFTQFKGFVLAQTKKGNIAAKEAQNWIDYYDPKVGKRPMTKGFKGPVTWTLKSAHRTGKAADVAHPTRGWNPKAGAAYWKALKAAAQAEGLQIGPPATDRAHVQMP